MIVSVRYRWQRQRQPSSQRNAANVNYIWSVLPLILCSCMRSHTFIPLSVLGWPVLVHSFSLPNTPSRIHRFHSHSPSPPPPPSRYIVVTDASTNANANLESVSSSNNSNTTNSEKVNPSVTKWNRYNSQKHKQKRARGRASAAPATATATTRGKNSSKKESTTEAAARVRWNSAVKVEEQMNLALETMQSQMDRPVVMLFPCVRECNAALATLGDRDAPCDFLRPLRLFVKMRKTAAFAQTAQKKHNVYWIVPAPTLVTYSTIMSRAVQAGKANVALRLWTLMKLQAEFCFNNDHYYNNHNNNNNNNNNTTQTTTASDVIPFVDTFFQTDTLIVPDVKAANILMNVYAKLADVESAKELLSQMLHGNGTDVPKLTPNLVTYNTLLDACQKSQSLDDALDAKQQLLEQPNIKPDARTYTSLIATVARKATGQHGARDPTLAFSLLYEMNTRKVRPNGMTYCALIAVCGRCERSDLAFKGLRIMLRQKEEYQKKRQQRQKKQKKHDPKEHQQQQEQYVLPNEVGAWTAAINACGKTGRIRSAIRLFYAMPNFGVQPNTITCGCLADCLLRNGRTSETLNVLQYMQQQSIPLSEVMYTSLITSAGKLVELENKKEWEYEKKLRRRHEAQEETETGSREDTSFTTEVVQVQQDHIDSSVQNASGDNKAIKVYTELMSSLMRGNPGKRNNSNNSNNGNTSNKGFLNTATPLATIRPSEDEESTTLLFKVFLIYQEMKAAGAKPDLACYNALLRACARAGDISRAQEVMDRMQEAKLHPNDRSWREMIRTAGKARRSDVAESTWRLALNYHRGSPDDSNASSPIMWKPSVQSFGALSSAYLRHAASLNSTSDHLRKQGLYQNIVSMYTDILEGNERLGSNFVDREQLLESKRTMLLVLRAVVALEQIYAAKGDGEQSTMLRHAGKHIISLESLQDVNSLRDRSSLQALRASRIWLLES